MKRSICLTAALLALTGSAVTTQAETLVKPDHRYEHVLSSSGPLSRAELQRMRPETAQGVRNVGGIHAASSNTYTYLRCYYRTSNDLTSPTTDYVWARNWWGGWYTVDGFWYGAGVVANMFYTNTSQSDLRSACQSTLSNQGINQPVAMMFAADNSLSFNYTLWTNDSNSGSTINKVVAFGDSLSDNQNMYNESDWLLPNRSSYYIGHFSNGYNWVEYMSQDLGLPVYDWAVGGAGVTTQDLVIPGVVEQVNSWQQYMTQAPNYNPQNTLFTMLIGGNDLVNYNKSVADVISGEQTALQNLINAGARNIL
ncbi:MAG: thermolabile hemolysin, partial [Burkholderiales bacterium]|nr:thermolabile hemolysin [Burkholderiales bacterium]